MSAEQTRTIVGALRATESEKRSVTSLDGIWNFCVDAEDNGEQNQFIFRLPNDKRRPIAVPASWNEQIPELDHFLGPAWYSRRFYVHNIGDAADHREVYLRFASVNYEARVYVNGCHVGEHQGGHLPFEIVLPRECLRVDGSANTLVVRVDGRLERSHVPPGGGWGAMAPGCFPSASFDFYPYAGIQRSVLLCTRPKERRITGLNVRMTLVSPRDGRTAEAADVELAVHHQVCAGPDREMEVRATLLGEAATGGPAAGADRAVAATTGTTTLKLRVDRPELWAPGAPHLYTLRLELHDRRGALQDVYEQPLGLRTVEIVGEELRLNGAAVTMRGFGRHEDFPLVGRGECAPVLVRDHECMRWLHANSYRTAHYPYSEADLDLADAHGTLVVSESPCVGLSYHDESAVVGARQAQARRALRELLERDANRTCVVAWSVCNEPGGPKSVPTADAKAAQTSALVELVRLAKGDWARRPVTFANIPEHCDDANRECDFLSLNEYAGWYYDVGTPLDAIGAALEAKLVALHASFGKPMMISECGADTLPGCHMMGGPGLWSEEFQSALLRVYTSLVGRHRWLFGVHVWNLCDFRTPQMHLRAGGLNHKGVFTRLREPKMAAHMLRADWAAAAGAAATRPREAEAEAEAHAEAEAEEGRGSRAGKRRR